MVHRRPERQILNGWVKARREHMPDGLFAADHGEFIPV